MKYAAHPTQSSVSSLAEVTGLAWTSELARKKVSCLATWTVQLGDIGLDYDDEARAGRELEVSTSRLRKSLAWWKMDSCG